MASLVTAGLTKIEVGAIAGDGGMGTVLAAICYTKDGGVKLVTEDPQITEFFAEEVDDAVVRISRKGKTTLQWTLLDPDATALTTVLGGTAAAGVWSAPTTQPNIELSVKVTPDRGLVIAAPRASFTGKINAEFSKKGIFAVDITATIMQPTKAATAPITATPKV